MERPFKPTSNDLLFRLESKNSQKAMNYTVIAQIAEEVQDIQDAPWVSIGPHLAQSEGRFQGFRSDYRPTGPYPNLVRFLS